MCLGIPARVVAIDDPARKLATVDVAGELRQVILGCLVSAERPAADCVGDWVLIHVGFAMRRIDEAEARETLSLLAELAAAQAEVSGRPPAPER